MILNIEIRDKADWDKESPYWLGASITSLPEDKGNIILNRKDGNIPYSHAIKMARLTDLANAISKLVDKFYSSNTSMDLSISRSSENEHEVT